MKYKIGDRVQVRSDLNVDEKYGEYYANESMLKCKGEILTIEDVYADSYDVFEIGYSWTDEMFESLVENDTDSVYATIHFGEGKSKKVLNTFVKAGIFEVEKLYTYPEILMMDKLPKKIVDVHEEEIFMLSNKLRYIDENDEEITSCYTYHTNHRLKKYFKIIKEEILTENEKEFLSHVLIDRDEIKFIIKGENVNGEYIWISYNDTDETTFRCFDKGTRYKNMGLYKKYTLEELGL